MKNLSGKDLLRGDAVIAPVQGGIQVGVVQQFYDRTNQIRISGYPIMIPAADTVLAQDAWEAIGPDLIKKRDEEAAKSKAASTPPIDLKKEGLPTEVAPPVQQS